MSETTAPPILAVALPPCSVENLGYNMSKVKPLGAVTSKCQHDCAKDCQEQCRITEGCTNYMYYKNSGGCWTFGNDVTLEDYAGVIAGPLACEFINQTEVPIPIPGLVVSPILHPSLPPVMATNSTLIVGANKQGIEGWLLWTLLALLLLLCGICVFLLACCGGKQSKKRSANQEAGSKDAMLVSKDLQLEAEAPLLALPTNSRTIIEVTQPVVTAVVKNPTSPAGSFQVDVPTPQSSMLLPELMAAPAPVASMSSQLASRQVAVPSQYMSSGQYAQAPVQSLHMAVGPAQSVHTAVAPPQYMETVVAPPQYTATVAAPAVRSMYVETMVAPPQYTATVAAPQYGGSVRVAAGTPAGFARQSVAAPAAAPQQPLFMEPIATGIPMT